MTWFARLRPAHIALLVPWIVAVVAARLPIRDNSFLWHVRAGTAQIAEGQVLTEDQFSFTRAGLEWRTQSWLAELLYGWLDSLVALDFVPWLIGSVASALFLGVAALAYRLTGSILATAVVGAATGWTSAVFLSPRPALFSFLLLAVLIAASVDSRLRWALPLLVWVWASVHSSYPLAFLLVAAMGWRRWRSVGVDLSAMGATALMTAHGFGLVEFLVDFASTRDALAYLTEWRTPELLSLPFVWVVPATVVVFWGAVRQRLEVAHLPILALALIVTVSATRSVLPGWLMLLPLLSLAIQGSRSSESQTSDMRASAPGERVLLSGIALLVLGMPFLLGPGGGLDAERFPIEAAEHLVTERVWTDDSVGGFLIYSQWPERQVFVDDRAELYGAEFFRDTVRTRSGTPTWNTVFSRWGITEALVGVDDGLRTALEDQGWVVRYEDDWFVVLAEESR